MEKKKIIIVGSAHPLRGGGISTFNERLAKAYMDSGHDVVIYSFSLQYPSLFFPGTSQFTDEPAPHGLKIRSKINSINPFNWINVGREICKLRPELVIVRFWIPFMAPCLGTISRILRRNKIKVVSIADNILPHEKKPADRLLTAYFVKSIDYFVTMSLSVHESLKRIDPKKRNKLTVHPLYDNYGEPISREAALKNLNLQDGYKYLLFFGFIREYKGLDLLLKAFSDRSLNKFQLRLLIVGEFYIDPDPYLKMIEDNNLKDKVFLFTHFIPNAEIINYFCAANLIVQPYKEATQSGITQIAYHFNKPMITTNVGGLAETVSDGKVGYVVNPDPHDIAIAIYKFFNEDREQEFSDNVITEKKRFSWDTMISAIEEVIA